MARIRLLGGISVFWIVLSVVGDGLPALVVPVRLAAIADGASLATTIGLVTFTGLLAGMLIQPIAGALSDRLRPRWGRRPMLVAGASLLICALVAFAIADGVAGIALAFVLVMAALGVAQAAQQGFIPDLVPVSWRGRAAGAKGIADLGGAFIGFLVLGSLLGAGRVGPALLVVGGLIVVGLLLTVLLVREPRAPAPAPATPLTGRGRSPLGAYSLTRPGDGAFVRLVLARFLFLLGIFAVGRFLLLFVAQRLGVDPPQAAGAAGGLLAALTVAGAVASLPAGWLADRRGRRAAMIGGALAAAVGAGLLAIAADAIGMLIFGGLMAIGSAAFTTANWAMAADLAPPPEAARYMGVANFGTAGAAATAGLFGLLADASRDLLPAVGYGVIFIAATVPILLSALIVAKLDRTAQAPAARATLEEVRA